MFLIRLMHLNKKDSNIQEIETKNSPDNFEQKKIQNDFKKDTVDQIKNITQEKKNKPIAQIDTKAEENILINSFDQLLTVCTKKKEIQLKYELEKNVNLVNFEKNRIEVSFNENLDKSFVKNLSTKLYEWTNERWIITFSKQKGQASIKEKEQNEKSKILDNEKKSDIYKMVLKKFPDANLKDVIPIIEDDN